MIKLSDAVSRTALAVAAAGTLWSTAAYADPLALFDPFFRPRTAFDEAMRDRMPGAADPSLHTRAPTTDEGLPGAADVPERVVELYYRVRYGGRSETAEELRELSARLADLRRALA